MAARYRRSTGSHHAFRCRLFRLTVAGLSPRNPALVLRAAPTGRRSLLVPETPVTMRELNDGRSRVQITRSKRNMRRAHDALKGDAYVEDKSTGELHRPHHIDLKTGMYRGRQVMKVKDRI